MSIRVHVIIRVYSTCNYEQRRQQLDLAERQVHRKKGNAPDFDFGDDMNSNTSNEEYDITRGPYMRHHLGNPGLWREKKNRF